MSSALLSAQAAAPVALFSVLSQLLSDAVSTLDLDRDCARDKLSRAVALLDAENRSAGAARTYGGLAPWQAKTAQRLIDANLDGNISVEELARTVRLSRSGFSRAFKETFLVAPQSYIVRRRVERAQEIMMESDEPLCQVAVACGFCDQSHFSRMFRQVTGQSPNAWRRARFGLDEDAMEGEAAAA